MLDQNIARIRMNSLAYTTTVGTFNVRLALLCKVPYQSTINSLFYLPNIQYTFNVEIDRKNVNNSKLSFTYSQKIQCSQYLTRIGNIPALMELVVEFWNCHLHLKCPYPTQMQHQRHKICNAHLRWNLVWYWKDVKLH